MNLIEISNKFDSELSCIEYAERIRWGKRIKCPYCKSVNIGSRNQDFRWHCKSCAKSFSVTTGTNLHNTRLPLKVWFYAFAVVTDAKKGVSAKQLERNLGVHYETAWTIGHKIRELMILENKEIELSGILEMDETFIGGKPRKFSDGQTKGIPTKVVIPELDQRIKELKEEGVNFKRKKGNTAIPDLNPNRGRGTNKIPVAGIVERDGNIIAEVMQALSYQDLKKLVKKHVDTDESVMVTDEFKSYSKFQRIIEHISVDHKRLYSYKGVNTNSIESFWAIVKRGIIGQYHQVSPKHLPNYIAEFVFKYNNRKEDDMFMTVVINSMKTPEPTNR